MYNVVIEASSFDFLIKKSISLFKKNVLGLVFVSNC